MMKTDLEDCSRYRRLTHVVHGLGPLVNPAELVNACEQEWHKTCLKCEKCNKLLASGGFLEKDGETRPI